VKIAVINPTAPKNDMLKGRFRQPLGLAWITSILKNDELNVELIDMNALQTEGTPIVDKVTHLIITSSPIDRWETPYLNLENVFKIIKEYKKEGAVTILTGPHGTLTPDQMFKDCPETDIIMRGEAEATVKDLFKNLEHLSRVKGISYKTKGKIEHNEKRELIEDLDTLPIPAYNQLPMDKYHYNVAQELLPSPFTIIETSKGCPYRCVFCLKAMHGGTKYRVRSPENVIEELKYLKENFGLKSFYTQDLEFTIDEERVIKICKLMIDEKLDLSWACTSRVNDVTDELLGWLKKAGCKSISFGIESLSKKILNNVKKGTTPEMIQNALKLCKKHEILFNRFYTQGHLGETKKTMEESLKNALKYKIPHPLDRGAKIIPYPGTEVYEKAKEEGLVKTGTWEEVGELAGKVGTEKGYDKPTLKSLYYFLLLRLKGISKKD